MGGHLLKAKMRYYQKVLRSQLSDAIYGHVAPFLAPIVEHMARTGNGTDACLRRGCLPMRVHFYSPVPDIAELEKRKVWDRRSQLVGIDFRADTQIQLLKELGEDFGQECNWPALPTSNPMDFHTENQSFSYECAASTHCMIRRFKPRKVIEIGSGNSSKVIAAALKLNAQTGTEGEHTIIDPDPNPICRLLPDSKVVAERVENLDVKFFDQLKKNDILFIDSGHTVRIGGHVNFEILEILPRLTDG